MNDQDPSAETNDDDQRARLDDDDLGLDEPIKLDRYLSKRRPPPRKGWIQMMSSLFMLAVLVAILMFKDRCGSSIARLFEGVAPSENSAPKDPSQTEKVGSPKTP